MIRDRSLTCVLLIRESGSHRMIASPPFFIPGRRIVSRLIHVTDHPG